MSSLNKKRIVEITSIDNLYSDVAEILDKYGNDMDLAMKEGNKEEKDSITSFFWNQAVGDVIFTYLPFTTHKTNKKEKKD